MADTEEIKTLRNFRGIRKNTGGKLQRKIRLNVLCQENKMIKGVRTVLKLYVKLRNTKGE